jgi:ribulose-5-phosphate 4-epimerase/fuculose-1-phosphate aldolase
MFDEVTASSLMKVRLDGKDLDEKGYVAGRRINRAGFTIHSAVLNARPEINFVCTCTRSPAPRYRPSKRASCW